jgi:hypothetical protein
VEILLLTYLKDTPDAQTTDSRPMKMQQSLHWTCNMSLVFYALHRHDLRPKFLQEIQTTPPKHAPGFQFIEMQEFLYYMTLSIETCFD